MTCSCTDKSIPGAHRHSKALPADPCAYCGEKHLGYARAMAMEKPYESENLPFVVGELYNAECHYLYIPKTGSAMAAACRAMRLAAQSRLVPLADLPWEQLLRLANWLSERAASVETADLSPADRSQRKAALLMAAADAMTAAENIMQGDP